MTDKQKLIVTSVSIGLFLFVFSYAGFKSEHHVFIKDNKKEEKIVERIASFMKSEGFTSEKERLLETARSIYKVSKQHEIDYRLALAIIKIESNFKYDVVSPKGARGLFQIKPSLAKYIAKDAGVHWKGTGTLDEPEKNVKIGVFFFSRLLDDFDNVHLALNAYNIGPTKLKSILNEKNIYNGNFSKNVLKEYKRITGILPPP
ncbi:MAG: lytic transglycosylase domain-containing protein [Syntrophorhabdaceae bacterium]|nr:lytic transglycosylase domain-containing protein [Syntrophorhabdaceae bacterium]